MLITKLLNHRLLPLIILCVFVTVAVLSWSSICMRVSAIEARETKVIEIIKMLNEVNEKQTTIIKDLNSRSKENTEMIIGEPR